MLAKGKKIVCQRCGFALYGDSFIDLIHEWNQDNAKLKAMFHITNLCERYVYTPTARLGWGQAL
jgi:hypothetical protein